MAARRGWEATGGAPGRRSIGVSIVLSASVGGNGMTNSDSVLDVLWAPRSVAVVGASADPSKTGGRPVHYLRKHGYAGQIWPINPRVAEIAGLPCHASIGELPGVPDLAIVLLGVERTEAAVRDLAARGCRLAIVLASGYAEAGEDGRRREAALRRAAGPMRLLGPNTIGAVDLSTGMVLSASAALEGEGIRRGGISVASQSGGILGSLLSRGAAMGLGFCKLVSTGNEADIDIADVIAAYAADPATSVIVAYVEGLRSVAKFREAAAAARAADKPVVVYKVGRSALGARAAVSHTGAMAGDDRLYDALFKEVGAIRAQRFSDLLDLPAMLVPRRRMGGKRVAILTTSGGAGSLIADSFGLAGLDLPDLDDATARALAEVLGQDEPLRANPVDLTLAGVDPAIMSGATQVLLRSDAIDGLVVVVGSSALARPEVAVEALRLGTATSDKPLVAYVSPHAPHLVSLLTREGVPAFTAPETCASALVAVQRGVGPAARPLPMRYVTLPVDLPSGTLNEAEAMALFRLSGVPATKSLVVRTADDAVEAARALGGPVVLKVLSRHIPHKSDVGGVRLGLSAADIGAAYDAMVKTLARQQLPIPEGFLVQSMVRGGIEMILGLRRDPQLGTFILLGAGGVQAEVSADMAVRLLPLSEGDARAMVAELRISRLLDGYRGAPGASVAELVEAIEAFAALGTALGDRLAEAEINPLFVMPKGQGVVAADGLVVLDA